MIKALFLEIAFLIMRICVPNVYNDMMNTPLPYTPKGYKPKDK